MPSSVDLSLAIGLEPAKAVEYFQSKGYEISFRWQDMAASAHAKAFTAAGVMRTDVLEAMREEVDKGIRDGIGMDQFVRNLAPRLQALGFWGQQEIVNEKTGEVRTIDITPWRLRNMYRINMQTALARGRWLEHTAGADFMPIWIYKSMKDGRESLEHGDLHNSAFRHDDPVWRRIYPPWRWGCRCWIVATDLAGLDRQGLKLLDGGNLKLSAPDDGWSFDPATPGAELVPRPSDSAMSPDPAMPGSMATALDPLKPRAVDADRILLGHEQSGWDEQQYVDAFLGEFGIGAGQEALFTDAVNEPLMVSENLFKDRAGNWKIFKHGRERYLLLLADALKDPQEIRIGWTVIDGKKYLRRRYITVYDLDGSDQPTLIIFEFAGGQWSGVTAFQTNSAYIDKQRAEYKDTLYKKGTP